MGSLSARRVFRVRRLRRICGAVAGLLRQSRDSLVLSDIAAIGRDPRTAILTRRGRRIRY